MELTIRIRGAAMTTTRFFTLLVVCLLATGCKLTIIVPEGGSVGSESGTYTCAEGSECTIDIVDALFDESFVAVPADGYEFKAWKKQAGFFCGNSATPCTLSTAGFDQDESLMALLAGESVFYIEPEFVVSEDEASENLGFEILEIISPTEIRAWISPQITRAEFEALELPTGWIKNQPREGGQAEDGPGSSRFLHSPDASDEGDILIEELFGFNWFHAATVIENGISLDEEGLLNGIRVRKYHEVTYAAGSTLVLLISPENQAYFRIGRDANRVTDEPGIPNLWQLVEYTTEEELVIELFDENLVIRTDNQDSFQGPVVIGEYGVTDEQPAAPLELTTQLCEDPGNMAVLQDSPTWQAIRDSGGLNEDQLQRMIAEPTRGPFYMLNLIRYREQAVYLDGRETDLTGREANALYSPLEYLAAIGAAPVFVTQVDEQIDGEDYVWQDVAIVEYPCPVAFFAMIAHPGFQARVIHKNAAVEKTIVMVTHLQPTPEAQDAELTPSPYPATDDDPAFELIYVMDFHYLAQYEEDANEPPRSGLGAWRQYQDSISGAAISVGARSTATFRIQGVINGDDRDWDEAYIVRMPSMAGYEALLADEAYQQGSYHRNAALNDNYSMITYPVINAIAGDSGSDEPITPPPVTDTGVGTVCTSDADCVGIGFCLSKDDGPGFCSRECGSGECGDGFLCCHSCSAFAAPLLPFAGSACMIEQAAGQLRAAPVSCSCN